LYSPADLYFGGAIAAFIAPWYCRTALALLGTWGRQLMIHSNKLDPSDSLSGQQAKIAHANDLASQIRLLGIDPTQQLRSIPAIDITS